MIEEGGKGRYIYSKYKPKQSIKLEVVEEDKDYIVLGLGLGYEVESTARRTNGKVYVIETNGK